MNFLAHCYLSCSDEEILIGNFITDFIKKKEEASYEGRILKGIELHRKIDSFTDKHPNSLILRKMLRKRHGKYASVVVDLLWDYFLSKNWALFSGQDLSSFTKDIYTILSSSIDLLPSRLSNRIDQMIADDFLLAYSTKERMIRSLKWMDNRVNFPSDFVSAIHDLNENEETMNELFLNFFPDIIKHTEMHCDC